MKKSPFFVWHERTLKKVCIEDIRVLKADRNYTKIQFVKEKDVTARCSLDTALKKLPADEFVKIHRSCAVAIHYIDEISRDCVRIKDKEYTISRMFYRPLLEKVQILGLSALQAKPYDEEPD